MWVFQFLVLRLAKGLDAVGSLVYRLSSVFHGFLPALLSPAQLQGLMREHYVRLYTEAFVDEVLADQQDGLQRWEKEVLDRNRMNSERTVLLGSGEGRDAIAVAQRRDSDERVEAHA